MAAGGDETWIGGWPTTTGVLVEGIVGMLVEGTLTDGTLVEGTLGPGTLTPGTLMSPTLTPGAMVTEGPASVAGAPCTETAPATVLTDAPSAAPQSAAASAFTVLCRRLRRCADMFSRRALPSGPPPADA